jgi:hypothetical protein
MREYMAFFPSEYNGTVIQDLSSAIGGEGIARSLVLDAQQYLSMACTKLQDATRNMQGVSVHQQMLQQDRRFMVSRWQLLYFCMINTHACHHICRSCR